MRSWPLRDTARDNRACIPAGSPPAPQTSRPRDQTRYRLGRAAGAHVQPCSCRQGPGAPHVPPALGHAIPMLGARSPALPISQLLLACSKARLLRWEPSGRKKLRPRVLLKMHRQRCERHRSLPDLAGCDGKHGPQGRKGPLEQGKYKAGIPGARITACLCNGANRTRCTGKSLLGRASEQVSSPPWVTNTERIGKK